ncbi:hypothetical protein PYCC9005_002972 [Savitreella phatthalungensis]
MISLAAFVCFALTASAVTYDAGSAVCTESNGNSFRVDAGRLESYSVGDTGRSPVSVGCDRPDSLENASFKAVRGNSPDGTAEVLVYAWIDGTHGHACYNTAALAEGDGDYDDSKCN